MEIQRPTSAQEHIQRNIQRATRNIQISVAFIVVAILCSLTTLLITVLK